MVDIDGNNEWDSSTIVLKHSNDKHAAAGQIRPGAEPCAHLLMDPGSSNENIRRVRKFRVDEPHKRYIISLSPTEARDVAEVGDRRILLI
ncbi:hypothetical protein SCMU_11040 [Sinomonas cyclohexanicum]|uniref:Uncharacterized protein n=1 Tax=Sinomonas cyclohexanicum TaxID=322009 RepID=A0ABM7PSR9_SINCY|nr:hypothetical protein SCMU_11040 [Corynebacterium cyclohexanicum]